MRALGDIQTEYENILASDKSDHEKEELLAALMNEMELQDTSWERVNKAVIALYRNLPISRKNI